VGRDISFVSVTQQFNTTTSMGRLTLNILLSFAQFEREIIGERIRDKVAAAKRKGKYTGGMPILGYDVDRPSKRLLVNDDEAKLVRHIFKRFIQLGSSTELAGELNAQGHRTKAWTTAKGTVQGGRPWNKAHLYRLLNNRKYVGEIEHKGTFYPGEHEAIVPRELWADAHKILAENYAVRSNRTRAKTPALLKGIVRCGHCGGAMGPTFTRKKGKTYRYYLCVHASKNGYSKCPVGTVAAGEIEEAVVGQLRAVFRSPELIAQTFRGAKSRESEELERLRREKTELEDRLRVLKELAARLLQADGNGGGAIAEDLRRSGDEIDDVKRRIEVVAAEVRGLEAHVLTEREVIEALERLDPVWEELFPGEQTRIVHLLVERVEVGPEGLAVRLRSDGIRSLVAEIGAGREREVEASAT
jgi:site-specific DNA recombinase